jgi:DNA-binding NarL/FixJ family response regulator
VKVLLCDDHVLFCEALRVTLRQQGHEVETAHRPDDAVERAAIGDIDTVVMDLSFPEGDALAAIRAITSAEPRPSVVVLTASVASHTLLGAIEAGATAVASKSQRLAEIVAILDRTQRGAMTTRGDVVIQLLRRMHRDDERRLADFLTARENEVLQHLVRGKSTHAIAAEMGVSYSTTRTHIQNILSKLGVHSRLEASAFAVRNGLVDRA